MSERDFQALLTGLFHGSVNYMQAWAKKTVNRHRDKLPVNPVELKSARDVLTYLDSKGLA